MADDIARVNGQDSFAYVGAPGWHHKGQELQPSASIEEWQQASGLNYSLLRSKVRYFADKHGDKQLEWADQHVLFRSDTHAPVAVVSDKYRVHQPKQILEFFRDLVGSRRFTLETAGVLKGGAVYWALAKTHFDGEVVPGDLVKDYLLLSTSADGTRRTSAKNVAERVVCANTLRIADSERGKEATQSHRGKFDPDALKADLGIAATLDGAEGSFEKFIREARTLANMPVTTTDAAKFTLQLLGGFDATAAYEHAKAIATGKTVPDAVRVALDSKHAQGIAALYAGAAKGSDKAPGTRWQYLNAVTEYVDHLYPARSDENRAFSAWFGNGQRIKDQAYALLTV